jgi:hypothetical protein
MRNEYAANVAMNATAAAARAERDATESARRALAAYRARKASRGLFARLFGVA